MLHTPYNVELLRYNVVVVTDTGFVVIDDVFDGRGNGKIWSVPDADILNITFVNRVIVKEVPFIGVSGKFIWVLVAFVVVKNIFWGLVSVNVTVVTAFEEYRIDGLLIDD